ncbi:hypothetical protein C4561_01835 [candidate division WWE3 bacterium]|uniref:Uncharacterized protein n=1 Tax=candidate division WWE3 bacterium TaxID=2053526 RepID=A0A3A4ZLU6_UNCKA|nr:MAG: hypothetical protein C4561_01835 [candidate division WWE3 bacterium]
MKKNQDEKVKGTGDEAKIEPTESASIVSEGAGDLAAASSSLSVADSAGNNEIKLEEAVAPPKEESTPPEPATRPKSKLPFESNLEWKKIQRKKYAYADQPYAPTFFYNVWEREELGDRFDFVQDISSAFVLLNDRLPNSGDVVHVRFPGTVKDVINRYEVRDVYECQAPRKDKIIFCWISLKMKDRDVSKPQSELILNRAYFAYVERVEKIIKSKNE